MHVHACVPVSICVLVLYAHVYPSSVNMYMSIHVCKCVCTYKSGCVSMICMCVHVHVCEHACVCVQGLRDRVIITSWVLLDFKQRDGKEKSEQGQYLKLKR